MELNTDKIMSELNMIGKNRAWLAGKIVVSRSTVHYWLKNKTIKAADRIAEALNMEARDLIK